VHPDKYVAMSDIELLLMPQHLLRQRLLKLSDTPRNNLSVEDWLKEYLTDKYNLFDLENIDILMNTPSNKMKQLGPI